MKTLQSMEIVEWLSSQIENIALTGGVHVKGYELEATPSIKHEIFEFWFSSLLEVVEYLKKHNFEFEKYLIAVSITLKDRSKSTIYSVKKLTDIISEIDRNESCTITIELANNGVEYLRHYSYYRSPVICDQERYDRSDVILLYVRNII